MNIPRIQYHHDGDSGQPFLRGSFRISCLPANAKDHNLVKLYLPEALLLV